jgi:hypothetical protein
MCSACWTGKLGAPFAAPLRSAALPLDGSRRVATEVDSSIFAEGFCFLAAPKRGERPHQRQSEPDFSLRLLMSQLNSSPAQLSCANHSNTLAMSIGKSPSRWISDGQIFMKFSTDVCRPDDNPQVPRSAAPTRSPALEARSAVRRGARHGAMRCRRRARRRLIGGEGPLPEISGGKRDPARGRVLYVCKFA